MKVRNPGTGIKGKENITTEQPNEWSAPLLFPQDYLALFVRHLMV